MKNFVLKISVFMLSALLFFAMQKSGDTPKTSDLRLTQLAGKQLLSLKDCMTCHNGADETAPAIKEKRSAEWFREHVAAESEVVIGESTSERRMRKYLENEIEALDDFLFNTAPAQNEAMGALPENIVEGAYLAYQNNCSGCHTIAGQGENRAPELTFVAEKHPEKSWHIENLKNPQQFAEESNMPAFADKLPDSALEKIADYLLTLRK